MAIETREARKEPPSLLLAWGAAAPELPDGLLGPAWLWLAGGAALAVWTVLAMVLTSG